MELDNLKQAWNTTPTPETTEHHLTQMMSEKTHPVLRPIRQQAVFEALGFGIFLAVYYTMFDGDQKPIWLNLVFVVALLTPLAHSLIGYRFFRFIPAVGSLQSSLLQYLRTAKIYALAAIACRVILVCGMLFFFGFGITFTVYKQLAITGALVVVGIQLFVLARIWIRRINSLKKVVEEFSTP